MWSRNLSFYNTNLKTHGRCRWENFLNYAFQIVSNRYSRVMTSWKEGTNQFEIGHKLGHLSQNRAQNFNRKLGQGSTPPSPRLGARLDYEHMFKPSVLGS